MNEVNEAVGGPLDGITDALVQKALLRLADRITADTIAPLLQALIVVVHGLNNGPNRESLAAGLRDAIRKAAE